MEKFVLATEIPTIPTPGPDGSFTLTSEDMRRLLEVVHSLRMYIQVQLDRCRFEQ